MINIYINDKLFNFDNDSVNIEEAVSKIENMPNNVVIALNNSIIQKDNWKNTMLKNDDKLMIIRIACGG
ncbi:MAG: sulfur carrier protein ThiS [Bacteroidetes bacterium]|nr:sulfur carrier protein ThiS [Bacteroidota bacterium]